MSKAVFPSQNMQLFQKDTPSTERHFQILMLAGHRPFRTQNKRHFSDIEVEVNVLIWSCYDRSELRLRANFTISLEANRLVTIPHFNRDFFKVNFGFFSKFSKCILKNMFLNFLGSGQTRQNSPFQQRCSRHNKILPQPNHFQRGQIFENTLNM